MTRKLIWGLLFSGLVLSSSAQWRPCVELKRDLRVPCKCALSQSHQRAIDMNCDGVIFTAESLEVLKGQPVVSLSQRNCGHQNIPESLINVGLPLEKLDLSQNSIHRLMDRLLQAQSRLRELRLANNLLGDNLNPIFSSKEFHELSELRLLDLRGNGLRSIEEGIFKGCWNLDELYLDNNNLTAVPTASLKGPRAIRILSLAENNIGFLPRGVFSSIGESLLRVDLCNNELSHIEDGALSGLDQLLFLNISRNNLTRFNSDAFKGVANLLQLDLSANFFKEFPADALRHLENLKFLNISNNLIEEIEQAHLSSLTDLQVLDFSRNNIARLGINSFSSLTALTRLDLSLNALRTIEESTFEALANLKWLSLQDNNILLVPSSALARLPSLTHLHVEFNRIAALSTELLHSAAPTLVTLGLTRNLVREIPAKLFANFERLASIELCGNMLSSISTDSFVGLEDTLLNLDLSYNRLTAIAELPLRRLVTLNLAGNRLKVIRPEIFKHLVNLRNLNLERNPLYGGFPPIFPSSLVNLDVSRTGLRISPAVLFLNLEHLRTVSLARNRLQQIDKATFRRIANLTSIDLSHNEIERIESSAFVGIVNLYKLSLRGNRLASFVGEYFNTGTGLEILDLADNRISSLSPTAFVVHPRLREIDLSANRFSQFPSDYVKSLQFLERIDLSDNRILTIGEFAFSQMGHLRVLDLSGNRIESVDELAFHNSTQLQILDLSDNELELLNERTMEGVVRLESLNLRNNKLSSLPETIFDPSRVRTLERIDLSGNRFNEIPVRALQRQSSSLSRLNMARNRMVEVYTQDVVSNVKELDLSGNPLSENAVRGILGEAKILRSLNLADTGIANIARLETPFLKRLNLSGNGLTNVGSAVLERTTLLETLDVSGNAIDDPTDLMSSFEMLPALQSLDISGNGFKVVNESSFAGLGALRRLRMTNLPNCAKIERNAFKSLGKLRVFHAYDFPKLGYFDVQGVLNGMNHLEILDVEIKDSSVGNEQLAVRTHPRLRELTLRGKRLRNVLSSALVGIRSPELFVGLKNTSVAAIPAALFFPIPRSTRVKLDVSGSQFSTISPQLIGTLDERSGTVELRGLDSNPVQCGCESRHLWSWLKSSETDLPVRCEGPDDLAGQILTSLDEDQLSCERKSSTRFRTTESTTSARSTTSEPEIIWTVAPSESDVGKTHRNSDSVKPSTGNPANTDDTLIIGIVGGVVAFIAIVVIVICICRLQYSSQMNRARMAAMASSIHEASVIRPGSAYSGKMNQDLYVRSYNGSTLGTANDLAGSPVPATPVQMMPFAQPMHMVHPVHGSPTQQMYGYYDNPPYPVYMTYSSDSKFDR